MNLKNNLSKMRNL